MIKTLVHSLVIVALLGMLGERSYAAYQWKQKAEQSGKLADAAATYLFADTEVKKDGKPLTRAQLLDLVLAEVLKNSAATK